MPKKNIICLCIDRLRAAALGAYGNTAEASLSPAEYILIKRPNPDETLFQDASFDIRWRSDGLTGLPLEPTIAAA